MTDDLAGQIRRDLYAIRDNYDEALEPARRGNGSQVKATKEPPLPIGAHILDERVETFRDLHYWCSFILDNMRGADNKALTTRVDLTVDGMTAFIVTWAGRIVDDFPDDAQNLAEDVRRHAESLFGIAFPPPGKEWLNIGPCPRDTARDGERVTCGTQLRAFPGKETIKCEGCGHDDTLHWWRERVIGHRSPLVTPHELTDILLVDLRMTVEPATVRQWFQRGKVERMGKDDKGRWLYDWAKVEVMLSEVGRKAA